MKEAFLLTKKIKKIFPYVCVSSDFLSRPQKSAALFYLNFVAFLKTLISWGLLRALWSKKMGGWHLRMNWGQEVCYASLHSEPASALGLPTVWSLWGNPGMTRCWEMSTLPTGYIPQRKVTSASSSGSLGFIVYRVNH